MTDTLFSPFATVKYAGEASTDPMTYRFYNPAHVVLGKPLSEHLRFAVAWWHSLAMTGTDPFGGATIERPWFDISPSSGAPGGEPMAAAKQKADAAFELFRVLGLPFFTFHDRDIVHEGASLKETLANLDTMAAYLADKMETYETKLLWGTANLFSHPRFMAGASTNPDPEVFAWSAATVKACMDVTRSLGGANYVLWGGREGYETLLNTNLKQEAAQFGRFLTMVVDYKHKTGFTGQILIEPKPKEPSAHQYDFDVATVYGFLKQFGLEREIRVNIEANHALLAGHSFEHEIATAASLGILGSLDMNRGDALLGWDTDQFPNDLMGTTMAMYHVIKAGGIGLGGLNFDAKVRRQSFTAEDLIEAHVGAVDLCARAFLLAAKLVEEGEYDKLLADRYAGWQTPDAQKMLNGSMTLDDVAAYAVEEQIDPKPRSGRQERIENMLARRLF